MENLPSIFSQRSSGPDWWIFSSVAGECKHRQKRKNQMWEFLVPSRSSRRQQFRLRLFCKREMEGFHRKPSKVHRTFCVKLNADFAKLTNLKKKKKKQLQCSEGFELFVLRQLYHCPTDGRLEFGRRLPSRLPEPKRSSDSTPTPPPPPNLFFCLC